MILKFIFLGIIFFNYKTKKILKLNLFLFYYKIIYIPQVFFNKILIWNNHFYGLNFFLRFNQGLRLYI